MNDEERRSLADELRSLANKLEYDESIKAVSILAFGGEKQVYRAAGSVHDLLAMGTRFIHNINKALDEVGNL